MIKLNKFTIFSFVIFHLVAASPTEAAKPKGFAKKIAQAEKMQERREETVREINAELRKTKRELAAVKTEIRRLEIQKKPIPESWQNRLNSAEENIADLERELRDNRDELNRAEEKLDELKEKAERADTADSAKPRDCAQCAAGANQAPHQAKSGWDTLAGVIQAVTPLGLGAMSTYGNLQAMKTQSSDYRYYGDAMIAQGLPFSPNSYGYGNSSISGLGNSGLFGMTGNQMSYGNGYNSGFNTGGMNMGFGVNMSLMGGYGMSGYGMGYPMYSGTFAGMGGGFGY